MTIKLVESDPLIEIELSGHTFTLWIWDAGGELAAIDKRHAGDPPGSQLFLDSVIELLRDRYGVAKCSRHAAWRFYCLVVDEQDKLKAIVDEQKKTTGSTPESATGLESIPEDGADSTKKPDSPTSTDSTPSES